MLNAPGTKPSCHELDDHHNHHHQQQVGDYQCQRSLDRIACAQSLHAMLSDAVHSMRGADPRVHRRAVRMGLSYAEEYAARSRQAHVAWPMGEQGATEQGSAAGAGNGDGPGTSSASAEADARQHGEVEGEELKRLWVEVEAARGDGARLAGLLEEGRHCKLLPGVPLVAGPWLQDGAGLGGGGAAQTVDMTVGVERGVEATAWRRLARLAGGGQQEAVEVGDGCIWVRQPVSCP